MSGWKHHLMKWERIRNEQICPGGVKEKTQVQFKNEEIKFVLAILSSGCPGRYPNGNIKETTRYM